MFRVWCVIVVLQATAKQKPQGDKMFELIVTIKGRNTIDAEGRPVRLADHVRTFQFTEWVDVIDQLYALGVPASAYRSEGAGSFQFEREIYTWGPVAETAEAPETAAPVNYLDALKAAAPQVARIRVASQAMIGFDIDTYGRQGRRLAIQGLELLARNEPKRLPRLIVALHHGKADSVFRHLVRYALAA